MRLLLILLAVLALAEPALAQADTTVSAGPWFGVVRPYVDAIVGMLVAAVLGWLAALIQKWTGISIEKDARDRLHSAAMTGVSAALNFAQAKANDLTVDVRNQVIADAIRWMETSVPDAIKHFGATPSALVQLASSKLAILAEAPSSVPVGTAPTPPNA